MARGTPSQVRSDPNDITGRHILAFWYPLALSWFMMSVAGSIVNAGIARLTDPAVELAAFGVAQPIAIWLESPIIYILGATVALVHNRASYRLMRRMMLQLSGAITLVFALLVFSPAYELLFRELLAVPAAVAATARPALWVLLPWPAAIAWRRFYQGVLIRHGHTRLVTLGTLFRLATLVLVVLLGVGDGRISGTLLGGIAMSLSVIVEAGAVTFWGRPLVRRYIWLRDESSDAAAESPDTRALWRFYVPLGLTDVMRVAAQPLLVAGIARATNPALALAAWPLANGLVNLVASGAMAFQEVVITFLKRGTSFHTLGRIIGGVGVLLSCFLALLLVTPLRGIYFDTIIDAPPLIEPLAVQASMLMVALPLLYAVRNLYRAGLIARQRTDDVQRAMVVNLCVLVASLTIGVAFSAQNGAWLAAGAMLAAHLVEVTILGIRYHSAPQTAEPMLRVEGGARRRGDTIP